MTAHLPWAVQAVLTLVLVVVGLGLLAMFITPMVHDSEEAGVNAHGWDEPTLAVEPEPLAAAPTALSGVSARPLLDVLATLFERYRGLAQDPSVPANPGAMPGTELARIAGLCDDALQHLHELPVDRLSRGLGFVQGVLAANGLLDVDQERRRNRTAFQRAYQAMGLDLPSGLDLPTVG